MSVALFTHHADGVAAQMGRVCFFNVIRRDGAMQAALIRSA